jgi:hypothetical protein
MRSRATKWAGLSLMLAAGLLAAGCERIAPVRTLPAWVRAVYVPMVQNQSYEPAIEEQATQLTQEAFLAEGQLDVVDKRDADAMLLVSIDDWRIGPGGTSGDKITDAHIVRATASVRLCEPHDPDSVIADLGQVRVMSQFLTDPRSVRFVAEPDRKEAVLREMASRIVFQTLNGFPTKVVPYGQGGKGPAVSPYDVQTGDVLRQRPGTAN